MEELGFWKINAFFRNVYTHMRINYSFSALTMANRYHGRRIVVLEHPPMNS